MINSNEIKKIIIFFILSLIFILINRDYYLIPFIKNYQESLPSMATYLYSYGNIFRDDLISMYTPLKKYIKNNNEIIDKLVNSNSVSIHIRQNKFTEQPHEKKNKDKIILSRLFTDKLIIYIKKSVKFFENNINDPVFFIWSNDFTGLEKYFDKTKFNYIVGNDPVNDFNLFSYAKHFIVGGSTFHWWGAYLNENSNKICVYPSNINPSGNSNFYPTGWKKI